MIAGWSAVGGVAAIAVIGLGKGSSALRLSQLLVDQKAFM